MYFEDIFKKLEPLWNREFLLENVEETETYIESIRCNYNELDNSLSAKPNYTWWEFAMLFTMYQVLTAYALDIWATKKVSAINVNEIPILMFEDYFRKNLEEERNENFLEEYQGFKNPVLFKNK